MYGSTGVFVISGELESQNVTIKPTKKRYLILLLYCCVSFCSHIQFVQYSSIPNVVKTFYDVNSLLVNLTATIWFIVYIPGTLFATSLFKILGLRRTILIGALFNVISTLLKCFSAETDRFWLTMCGQVFVSISEIFLLSIPPYLAASWYPTHQISKATAVGYASTVLGVAIGMSVPAYVVPNTDNIDKIRNGLMNMFISQAVLSGISFLLIIAFFTNKPKYTPSSEQATAALKNDFDKEDSYLMTLSNLISNRNFMIISISFGIMKGVGEAVSINLAELVLQQFPDAHEFPGTVGLTFIISGIPGSIVCGLLLDACRKLSDKHLRLFLWTPLILYTLFFSCLIFSIFVKNQYLMIAIATCLGLVDGSLPVSSYEFGGKVTYPLSQFISAPFQNCISQIFSLTFSLLGSYILTQYGLILSNIFLIVFMIASVSLIFLTKNKKL